MSRHPVFRSALASVSVLLAASSLAGCAANIAREGYQVNESSPHDVKVGEDTKSTVLARLGSPSAQATFDTNTWYYISQTTERYTYHAPQVNSRDITVVSFDPTSEQVTAVRRVDLKDGHRFAYNSRETPTRGREMTVLEQLLGTVGRTLLPQSDEERVPGGQRPGD